MISINLKKFEDVKNCNATEVGVFKSKHFRLLELLRICSKILISIDALHKPGRTIKTDL